MTLDLRGKVRAIKTRESTGTSLVVEIVSIKKIAHSVLVKQTVENKSLDASIFMEMILKEYSGKKIK